MGSDVDKVNNINASLYIHCLKRISSLSWISLQTSSFPSTAGLSQVHAHLVILIMPEEVDPNIITPSDLYSRHSYVCSILLTLHILFNALYIVAIDAQLVM